MRGRWGWAVLLAMLTGGTMAPAQAQVAWDGPMLMAPGAPAGWGFHLFDPHPGSGLGLLATWRVDPAPIGFGFRAGIADGTHDDLGILAGIDVSGMLHREDGDVPIDVMWFAGGGFGLDGDVLLSVPAGISVGWAFLGDEVSFQPYAAPKVVLDAHFNDDVDDKLDLQFAFEIGLDLVFASDWMIRAAASLADRDALSIGFQVPR